MVDERKYWFRSFIAILVGLAVISLALWLGPSGDTTKDLEPRIVALEGRINDYSAKLSQFSKQLSDISGNISTILTDLPQMKHDLARAVSALPSIEKNTKDMAILRNLIRQFDERVDQIIASVEALPDVIDELPEIAMLAKNLHSLQEQLTTIETQLNDLATWKENQKEINTFILHYVVIDNLTPGKRECPPGFLPQSTSVLRPFGVDPEDFDVSEDGIVCRLSSLLLLQVQPSQQQPGSEPSPQPESNGGSE